MTVAIFAIFSVYSIPTKKIADSITCSASTFEEEGLYPVSFGNKYSTLSFLGRDQYTDCLMLNLAVSSDSDNAFRDAVLNPCYKGGYNIEEWPDNLRKLSNNVIIPDINYDWYWHGYLVVLKPLLLVFDYNKIRWFNCMLMAFLFGVVLVLIKKNIGNIMAVLTLAMVLLMHGEVIPYTMQYASVFFIALLGLAVLFIFKDYFSNNNNDLLAFFVIGALSVFFDFLTTPIVTLGIPIIYWLMLDKSEKKIQKVILISLMWGLGYAMLWISKWGLCALTFDSSVLENAALHADKWSGNDPSNGRIYMTIGVIKKYLMLLWSMNWVWGCVIAIFVMVLFPKVKGWWRDNAWLLLVAAMPFVWSFVLVNHNYVHFGFAWRNIIVCLLALSMWIYKSIDWKKIR